MREELGRVVLVCGGRHYSDEPALFNALDLENANIVIDFIINGGASGADNLSSAWARSRRVMYEEYMADWLRHGRSAGPIRNQRMIDEGKPDLVVAFPGGKGTADMVRRAKAAGIEVREIA